MCAGRGLSLEIVRPRRVMVESDVPSSILFHAEG